MGEVVSRTKEITGINDLWGPVIFHAVLMALGGGAIGKAVSIGRTGVVEEKTTDEG